MAQHPPESGQRSDDQERRQAIETLLQVDKIRIFSALEDIPSLRDHLKVHWQDWLRSYLKVDTKRQADYARAYRRYGNQISSRQLFLLALLLIVITTVVHLTGIGIGVLVICAAICCMVMIGSYNQQIAKVIHPRDSVGLQGLPPTDPWVHSHVPTFIIERAARIQALLAYESTIKVRFYIPCQWQLDVTGIQHSLIAHYDDVAGALVVLDETNPEHEGYCFGFWTTA
jgi:hypothetical protein